MDVKPLDGLWVFGGVVRDSAGILCGVVGLGWGGIFCRLGLVELGIVYGKGFGLSGLGLSLLEFMLQLKS